MSSTTTTTQTRTQTQISPTIRFDPSFLTLQVAIPRGIGFILSLACFITINVSAVVNGSSVFFNTVISIEITYSIVMTLLYLFHVPEKFYRQPWLQVELGMHAIISLLLFISSLMVILTPDAVHTIAGVFGFLLLGIHFYEFYYKYQKFRNGELAQGSLTTTRSTTTTTQSSAYPA